MIGMKLAQAKGLFFDRQVVTNAADRARGFPSLPENSTSYGSSTGRSESGTGTIPQRSQ